MKPEPLTLGSCSALRKVLSTVEFPTSTFEFYFVLHPKSRNPTPQYTTLKRNANLEDFSLLVALHLSW